MPSGRKVPNRCRHAASIARSASFARLRREAPALAEPFLHALSQILVGRLRVLNKRYVDSLLMLQTLAVPGPVKTNRRGVSAISW